MPDWASLRAEFPLLDRYVYLNACSLGPLPLAGKAALEAYARAWLEKGTPAWYSDWLPVLDRLRSRVADLLHARPAAPPSPPPCRLPWARWLPACPCRPAVTRS